MPYELQAIQIARDLRVRFGALRAVRLMAGGRVELRFERGEWTPPAEFVFAHGGPGAGCDCLLEFLRALGFEVERRQIERGIPGDVLRCPRQRP